MDKIEEDMAGQVAEEIPSGASRRHTAEGGRASWEEPHLRFRERFRKHWRQMLVHLWGPAGSIVFHIVAIGVLVTYATNRGVEQEEAEVVSEPVVLETRTEPELEKLVDSVEATSTEAETPKMDSSVELPQENNVILAVEASAISDSAGQEAGLGNGTGFGLVNKGAEISTMVKSRLVMKGLYSNRTADSRKTLLAQYGKSGAGQAATEAAVLRGLRWLKKNQEADGSWLPVKPAMTGLALLTYLAHGETPQSLEFGTTVRKALDWFVANQDQKGHFNGKDEGKDYSQSISAYALCEAYALTQHPVIKDTAIRAIKEIVNGQNSNGGFYYNLDSHSDINDTSVMAWCAQAMKAAKMAGLKDDVPGLEAAMKKAVVAFKMNAVPSGGFGYKSPDISGLSGAGALSIQLLGFPSDEDVLKTMRMLKDCTFNFDTPNKQPYYNGVSCPLYYWYYVTQAKFQYSPDAFTAWNSLFSPELCKRQKIEKDAIEGPDGKMVDIGYWVSPADPPPRGPLSEGGGKVMDTSLCCLMLEVYYRYLPSFKKDEGTSAGAAAIVAPQQDDVTVKIQ